MSRSSKVFQDPESPKTRRFCQLAPSLPSDLLTSNFLPVKGICFLPNWSGQKRNRTVNNQWMNESSNQILHSRSWLWLKTLLFVGERRIWGNPKQWPTPEKTEVTDTLIVWAHRPYHHCLTWSSMVSWMGRFSKNLRFQAGSRIYIYIYIYIYMYIKVISRTHHEEMHGGLSVLSSTNQAATPVSGAIPANPKKVMTFFFTKVFQGNHHLPVILRKLSLT